MREKITDPVLGDKGVVESKKGYTAGIFTMEFAPTQSQILVLVTAVDGNVPQSQRDLYREIETWYSIGVPMVFAAIEQMVEKNMGLRQDLPPDQILKLLNLTSINIRTPFSPPAKCILYYRYHPDAPDVYVRMGPDLQVQWCGLLD